MLEVMRSKIPESEVGAGEMSWRPSITFPW